MHLAGSVAGSNVPTAFLLSGKRKCKYFSDAFLVKHGAAPRRTIVMTELGYVTEEYWIEIYPSTSKGIHSMPFVQDNPQW